MAALRAAWAAAVATARSQLRYPVHVVGLLIWPVLLPGTYVLQAAAFSGGSPAAAAAFAQRTGTASIAGFLFVGFAVYMWISNVLWGPGTLLRQQQVAGQLEALYLTPASRVALLLGPSAGYLFMTAWTLLATGLVVRFVFGVPIGAGEAARALLVVGLAVPAMQALGAAFAVAVLVFKEVMGLVQFLRGLFQVFCGITFPIVVLPGWAQQVALALPPTYILRSVRAVLLAGASLGQVGDDVGVLLLFAVGLFGLGVAAFAGAEAYARRGGSLGAY